MTPSVFQARWTPSTDYLRRDSASLFNKVTSAVLSPFRYVGGMLARHMILPATRVHSASTVSEAESLFRNHFAPRSVLGRNYSVEKHRVQTPDGACLDVVLLRSIDAPEGTPTVLKFNGNCELSWRNDLWLPGRAAQRGIRSHFVYFDYRGVGASTGQLERASDLILDGISVTQWVQERLGTPPEAIHFHGVSLGGAVAVHTKAAQSDFTGPLVCDRSFARLDVAAQHVLGNGAVGSIAAWMIRNLGHQLNPAALYPRLPGPKYTLYHPLDRIIPLPASLAPAVGEAVALQAESHYESAYAENHHNMPVALYPNGVVAMDAFLPRRVLR